MSDAVKKLNIELDLSGDASDGLTELDQEINFLKENFGEAIEQIDFFSTEAVQSFAELGESIADQITNKSNPEIANLAQLLGKSEKELNKLIQKNKNEMTLDENILKAAKAAGLTDKEVQKLNSSLDKTSKTGGHVGGMLKAIAGTGLVAWATSFGSASLDAFTSLEKQRSMLENLAGNSYPKLEESINDALKASQGLSSEGQLKEAANQALKMGANVDFVANSLSGLQKVSAITGRDLNEVMQKAQESIISGSDEFLKKNGAVFGKYQAQFKQIGTGADETSKRMREALIMKALKENSDLTEQYGRHMQTAGARAEVISQRMGDMKENIGQLIATGLKPLQLALIPILDWFTDAESGMARTQVALMILAPIIGTVIVAALWSMAAAGWAAIAPWIPFIAIAALVGVAIAGIVMLVDDLLTWMDGGESIIGDFLGPFKDFDLAKLFKGMLDKVLMLVRTYGKYVIMALFPVSALYFFWDDIVAFVSGIPDKIVGVFEGMKNRIKALLADILPESFLKGLKSIGIDLSGNSENVNDAIITKDGKVIHTHPDDNLYAFKELPSGGQSTTTSGSGIGGITLSLNIDKVVLGGNSSQDDAESFIAMLERMLDEKIAPKVRILLGLPEEKTV